MNLPELKRVSKKELPVWLENITKNITSDVFFIVNTGDTDVLNAVKKKYNLVVLAVSGLTNYLCYKKDYKQNKE